MVLDSRLDEMQRQEYEQAENARRAHEDTALIKELEQKIVAHERILEVLITAGHLTKERVEMARKLVQQFS